MKPKFIGPVETETVAFYRLGGVIREWPMHGGKSVLEQAVRCGASMYADYLCGTACAIDNILVLPRGLYWDGYDLYYLVRTPTGFKRHALQAAPEDICSFLLDERYRDLTGRRDEIMRSCQRHGKLHGRPELACDPPHMRNELLVPSERKPTSYCAVDFDGELRHYYRFKNGDYEFVLAETTVESGFEELMLTSRCFVQATYVEVMLASDQWGSRTFVVSRRHEALVLAHWWTEKSGRIEDEHDRPLVQQLFGCSERELVFVDGSRYNLLDSNVKRKYTNIHYCPKRHRFRVKKNNKQLYFTLTNYLEYDSVFAKAQAYVNSM